VAVVGWIGVIFFSSTSTASRWCEAAFSYLSWMFISGLPRNSSRYGLIHLAADKGLHLTLFVVLAALLFQAMANPHHKIVRILLFGLVVGCCSEFLQSFFPDRYPAILDVLINLAGTAFGVLVSRVLWKRRNAIGTPGAIEYSFGSSDGA